LRHEHILQSFGYFQCPKSVALVLDYAKYGNLSEYKRKEENETLSIHKTVHFLRQIVSALPYLESRHIAHRDIKPENIVRTTVSTAKLCDFGFSIHSPPSEMRTTLRGTPEFVSPEMLTTPIEYAACCVEDSWALGVLTYELVHGNTPFFVEKSEKDRIAAEKGYAADYQVNFDRIRASCRVTGWVQRMH
jgi:serine/threonine protein kinase